MKRGALDNDIEPASSTIRPKAQWKSQHKKCKELRSKANNDQPDKLAITRNDAEIS